MLREKPPQVVGVGDGEAGEEGIEGGFLGVADAENALDVSQTWLGENQNVSLFLLCSGTTQD